MKNTYPSLFILLCFLIPCRGYSLDYDLSLSVEAPYRMYGQQLSRSPVFHPGITCYFNQKPLYIGSDVGISSKSGTFSGYGGYYAILTSTMSRLEWEVRWWEKKDSLTTSLRVIVSYSSFLNWQFSTDWDPLAGRLCGLGEVQQPIDRKIPWILSFYTGINFTSYRIEKYSQKAGLSEAGIGIGTWGEIGPWYGELSLKAGPDFNGFKPNTFHVSCQLLIIWSNN
ncbi:MAG: hypothetical protein PHE86_00345 [Candidatus Marinimicrobia bacterium]|nr:hypothetical protein [Candidatus Neomarinimicrobiota bacterium]MDD5581757.1 hypothetical protein [Candidatus Neomarinimicrobiota bacterium]